MLVGQHHRDDLTVYYLGEELFAAIIVAFNTFETREAMLLDYTAVKDITLKEGWLYRKMIIKTENERMKYGTSKVLLSDFQTENFNYFIDGQKERVIFKMGNLSKITVNDLFEMSKHLCCIKHRLTLSCYI